jgi:hypothetical protein
MGGLRNHLKPLFNPDRGQDARTTKTGCSREHFIPHSAPSTVLLAFELNDTYYY